jgi:23S rRNA (guanine2445-N2)-methyltransferase / 23S rRNA (guanine2069-N7)-methyltransferase
VLLNQADEQAEQHVAAIKMRGHQHNAEPTIYASDIDARAVDVARESAKRAGVASLIHFEVVDVANFQLPAPEQSAPEQSAPEHHQPKQRAPEQPTSEQPEPGTGLLVCNPPYGERISTMSQLPALYAALGKLATGQSPPLDAVIITPDDRVDSYLGGAPTQRIDTYNGALETAIRVWMNHANQGDVSLGSGSSVSTPQVCQEEGHPDSSNPSNPSNPCNPCNPCNPLDSLDSSATQFANRLSKMAVHRAKWARRSGVNCYRVYDADLPDYAVALDLYQGAPHTRDASQCWLHISEYAPPQEIDEQGAAKRLAAVLRIAPQILKVPTQNVFLKQRRRSKGGAQYAAVTGDAAKRKTLSGCATTHLVAEAGHTFEVEFAQHLDTGLFLDHRLTRALLQEHASNADCLNLFAYTGTGSVYMAAGAARGVTTVDLSATYLAWARRNMERNGFKGARYCYVQADALAWVQEHRHAAEKYGLIFVDPPTFSNSASMGRRTWDVQRDHAELLIALSRMLAPGGIMLFSCNLRSFKPDVETLQKAKVRIQDITARTIPQDFERNKKIHHCYLLTR